ncbi:MAG: class I SAM-dependent methyltransferase [Balneola sp.]|jgi:predicted O-methyltransferase YrrM|tara:strand:- start:58487 stop:59326 length:840 start_codon:yes stop_codon:yes gene_type:complete
MIKFFKKLLWEDLKIKRSDIKIIFSFTILASTLIITAGFFLDLLSISVLLSFFSFFLFSGFYHAHGLVEESIQHTQQKNQTLFSIYNTIEPKIPLPLMTGWAATPELIYTILKEISFQKPLTIFEIGSGSSTIISSLFLKKMGNGKVISIDHDDKYYGQNKAGLETYEVDHIAELYHAPLKKYTIKDSEYLWYNLENVPIPDKIDLLVIDGPPFKLNPNARYPALPLLYKHLNDKAVIILDDADREDEGFIVRKWAEEHPELTVEFIGSEKGVAILRKN